MTTEWLQCRNWDHWQTYRRDRNPPPWIKVHRRLLQDLEWSMLTDAEKGQLVSIWILAADRDGKVPSYPQVLQRLLGLETEPNISKFMELGFLAPCGRQTDANVTSTRRQTDAPEAEAEEINRGEEEHTTPKSPSDLSTDPSTSDGEEPEKDAGGQAPPHPAHGQRDQGNNPRATGESPRQQRTNPRAQGTNPRSVNGVDSDTIVERWTRLVWHCRQGHRILDVTEDDPALAEAAKGLGGMTRLKRLNEQDLERERGKFASLYRQAQQETGT